MLLRLLTPHDVDAFRAMRIRCLEDHPEAFGSTPEDERAKSDEALRRLLTAAPEVGFFLGAFDDGALVGMMGLKRGDRGKYRHKATLVGVYVAPEARGTGVARAMLAEVVVRAGALPGLARLNLAVAAGNAPAVRLYEQAGFQPWGLEPCAIQWEGGWTDSLHMQLQL